MLLIVAMLVLRHEVLRPMLIGYATVQVMKLGLLKCNRFLAAVALAFPVLKRSLLVGRRCVSAPLGMTL